MPDVRRIAEKRKLRPIASNRMLASNGDFYNLLSLGTITGGKPRAPLQQRRSTIGDETWIA